MVCFALVLVAVQGEGFPGRAVLLGGLSPATKSRSGGRSGRSKIESERITLVSASWCRAYRGSILGPPFSREGRRKGGHFCPFFLKKWQN